MVVGHEQRPCSNNRLMYLLDRLDRLKYAYQVADMEESMYEFTNGLLHMRILKDGLLQPLQVQPSPSAGGDEGQEPQPTAAADIAAANIFIRGDETMLQDLHAHGAIVILLDSIRRGMSLTISPEFYNSACIALIHFAFQSKERSRYMFQSGGFNDVILLMHRYRCVDYVQIIGIALMMVVGKNVGFSPFLLEYPILHEIVLAMEHHCESSKVYTVSCSALGTLFGPESSFVVVCHDNENELYHRALNAICFGLVLHLDDTTAMETGNNLLHNMVGPRIAEEMITDCENEMRENYYGGGCKCFAAAAAA